eukprot:390825_1
MSTLNVTSTTTIINNVINTTKYMYTSNIVPQPLDCDDTETKSLFNGTFVSIMYGGSHIVLLLILAFRIYWVTRASGDSLSFRKYLLTLWNDRAIYTPLLIHIYDTATDVGVLYEWYGLAQYEKQCSNLESLNMVQFFWTAIGFLIVYRSLLAIGGWIAITNWIKTKRDWNWCICIILGIFGAILGGLELMVFIAIWVDFEERSENENAKGAGPIQKACQSSEGVLESLPEVIMQSVFYMRAKNDPVLNARASSIFYLVAFSIIASLLSITSKYVWLDEFMVKDNTKSLIVKDEDLAESEDHECIRKVICGGKYNVSYGYIIRMLWRLAAVSARFVIFALIWVVLGGAFEIVFVPIMIVLWWLLLFVYATRGNCKGTMEFIKGEIFESDKCTKITDCLEAFVVVILYILIFCIGGAILQLGIAGISGPALYALRVVENFIIMIVITIFAFYKFDCEYCADKHQRYAVDNYRILSWIICGWISITIHLITSLIMPKIIDPEYDLNVTTQTEDHWKEWQREQEFKQRKYLNIQRMETMLQTKQPFDVNEDFFLNCICGNKLLPKFVRDINNENEKDVVTNEKEDKYGYFCSKCEVLMDDDQTVYHCDKGPIINLLRHHRGYKLCINCLEYKREIIFTKSEQINTSKAMIEEKMFEDSAVPICKCGQKLLLIPAHYCYPSKGTVSCASCYRKISGRGLAWYCITGADNKQHPKGLTVCKKCMRNRTKYDNWLEEEAEIEAKIQQYRSKSAQTRNEMGIADNFRRICKVCHTEYLLLTQEDTKAVTKYPWKYLELSCDQCNQTTKGEYVWNCGRNYRHVICRQCMEKNLDEEETPLKPAIELAKVRNDDADTNETLNNDEEKEMEYVTPQ